MVRIKHRYLLLNIIYPSTNPSIQSKSTSSNPSYLPFLSPTSSTLDPGTLIRHIRASIASNFGDYGHGVTASSLKVIYLSNATSTAIIRCPRAHFRIVWASLTFMDALPAPEGREGYREEAGQKCVVRVVRVSGTVKKAEEEVVSRAKQEILRLKMTMGEGTRLDLLMSGKGSVNTGAKGTVQREDDWVGIEDLDENEEDNDNELE